MQNQTFSFSNYILWGASIKFPKFLTLGYVLCNLRLFSIPLLSGCDFTPKAHLEYDGSSLNDNSKLTENL